MANNEHKNLRSENRHNPKNFESALNNSVLTKALGTGANNYDGDLSWINKSSVGSVNYKMQGYAVGLNNFQHGEDIADNKSPFIMDVDYGSTLVASGSLSPTTVFRIGQSCVIHRDSTVIGIYGWLTSSGTSTVTIAICKVTPNPSSTDALVPTVIDEFVIVGGGNNSKLVNFSQSLITLPSLSSGDIIFPMIKEQVDRSGSNLYTNLNIESILI